MTNREIKYIAIKKQNEIPAEYKGCSEYLYDVKETNDIDEAYELRKQGFKIMIENKLRITN